MHELLYQKSSLRLPSGSPRAHRQMRVERTPGSKRSTVPRVTLAVLVFDSLVGSRSGSHVGSYHCTSVSDCQFEGCNDRQCSSTASYCDNGKWSVFCVRTEYGNDGYANANGNSCYHTDDGISLEKCPDPFNPQEPLINDWSYGCTTNTHCQYSGCPNGRCGSSTGEPPLQCYSEGTCPDPPVCVAGTFSPLGGGKNGGGEKACQQCPPGKFSGLTTQTNSSSCQQCPPGKFGTATGASVCTDCIPGKYSPTSGASSKSVCINCATGTYVNVTGATTCLECSQDSCPFPGYFQKSSCTPKTNKVCEVYVHEVPTNGKIAIACGQVPLVCLTCYMVFQISKPVMGAGENWKWTVFELVAGFNDVISDFTTLYLILWRTPFHLFQLSMTSLGCSVTASLVLSFYSRIKLPWPTRFFIFISGTAEEFDKDWPEKRNSRIILCVENIPQLVVQAILVYLQGSQGFTGWDWAILVQSWLFTITSIFIKSRKVVKDLRGGQEERIDEATDVSTGVLVVLPAAADVIGFAPAAAIASSP